MGPQNENLAYKRIRVITVLDRESPETLSGPRFTPVAAKVMSSRNGPRTLSEWVVELKNMDSADSEELDVLQLCVDIQLARRKRRREAPSNPYTNLESLAVDIALMRRQREGILARRVDKRDTSLQMAEDASVVVARLTQLCADIERARLQQAHDDPECSYDNLTGVAKAIVRHRRQHEREPNPEAPGASTSSKHDAARTTKAEPNPAVLAVPPVKQTLTREEWMAELSAYDWRAKQYLSGELEDAWESLDEDDTPPPSPLRGMRRL
ncbi:hypothetical protein FA13DRAFT_1805418 [Coprinellus micaceus]|uniref:Uncharacterized protein n=1 Tax=Coprinellus micaceus TaxID=71717 RepID=A0A4Y7S0K6_COPMI|nr:hypothetical protein FA13DRAFT_1805418 [Coprinellus micaceus]